MSSHQEQPMTTTNNVYEQIQEDEEYNSNNNASNNDMNRSNIFSNNNLDHNNQQYHQQNDNQDHQYTQETTSTNINYLSNCNQHQYLSQQQTNHTQSQQYQYQQLHQQQQHLNIDQHLNSNQTSSQLNRNPINKQTTHHQQSSNPNSQISSNFNDSKQNNSTINISINKTQKKGTIMSYYYVYIIQGHDTKGTFSIPRRFNQFYQMRTAIVNRWPGCFVPSIPAKNALAKNDPAIIKKRTRYLNDFVNKISQLPHLYYGEQFQTLLRSQEHDVSDTFTKWPQPTSQSIINKYRVNFSQLAGKQLNFETQQKISSFYELIKRNQSQLVKERQTIKLLAQSQDRVIRSYAGLFSSVFVNYEKQCYSIYCDNKETDMLYLNQAEVKLQQHGTLAKQATTQNPYWILYDIIRHQQRDALAFSEVFQTKLKYQQKKLSIQQKILENEKKSTQISMGKKSMLSTQKSTGDDMRQKLEHELSQLQREKQNMLIIIDIISAMISYIEIERYKSEKRTSYRDALTNLGNTQISSVQNLGQVWNGLRQSCGKKVQINKQMMGELKNISEC